MSNNDNNDHSLMSSLSDQNSTYSPHGRKKKPSCFCNTARSLRDQYHGKPKSESLVAYIRASKHSDIPKYRQEIEDYCKQHSYKITEVCIDEGDQPSFGLQEAFDALQHADGLISCQIGMFIKAHGDRTRELRPFIHHFFCMRDKHLITIMDGIDTGSSFGQENAINLICETKLGFET